MAKVDDQKKKKVTKKVTNKNTKKIKKGPKEGYFKKLNKELKLVKWPKANEVLKYTLSTIVFCLILCAVFMLLNLLLSVVKGWI